MRKRGLLALAVAFFLFGARAEAQEMPKFGIGISNQLSILASSIGAGLPGAGGGSAFPLTTISSKFFFAEHFGAEVNLGILAISPETGNTRTDFMFGGKFHYILHKFTHGHFFTNAGFHFVQGGNPDFLAFNFNINGGFEYILPAGLPGLGFSPEFGFSFTHVNPDGDRNNFNIIHLGGYGGEFPYLLMNIRYYFM